MLEPRQRQASHHFCTSSTHPLQPWGLQARRCSRRMRGSTARRRSTARRGPGAAHPHAARPRAQPPAAPAAQAPRKARPRPAEPPAAAATAAAPAPPPGPPPPAFRVQAPARRPPPGRHAALPPPLPRLALAQAAAAAAPPWGLPAAPAAPPGGHAAPAASRPGCGAAPCGQWAGQGQGEGRRCWQPRFELPRRLSRLGRGPLREAPGDQAAAAARGCSANHRHGGASRRAAPRRAQRTQHVRSPTSWAHSTPCQHPYTAPPYPPPLPTHTHLSSPPSRPPPGHSRAARSSSCAALCSTCMQVGEVSDSASSRDGSPAGGAQRGWGGEGAVGGLVGAQRQPCPRLWMRRLAAGLQGPAC
jgi:hypothetical protein